MRDTVHGKQRSLRSLEWLNFFLADVQTGLGPFLAAYLASSGWNPGRVGYALTFGGLVSVTMQTPAGAVIDAVHHKRGLLAVNLAVLVSGAFLLMGGFNAVRVYIAQFLIGISGPFLGPTVAAITLGIVGTRAFDKQFGKNQAFNSAGNVFSALLIAYVSYHIGYHAIFLIAALLAIPAGISLLVLDVRDLDYARARGAIAKEGEKRFEGLFCLFQDRVLLCFLVAAFLFHLANAAMLPQLGEMLSEGHPRDAAPFMSACIIVTQIVIAVSAAWIGTCAATKGRKPLLLLGFGVLPIRGVLYTLTRAAGALIAIQILDGIANAVFGIVSILVVKDRTQGTGRFNIVAGSLATMVGVGAAASTTIGGVMIQRLGYRASFLGLAGIASIAFAILCLAVPETLTASANRSISSAKGWLPRPNRN